MLANCILKIRGEIWLKTFVKKLIPEKLIQAEHCAIAYSFKVRSVWFFFNSPPQHPCKYSIHLPISMSHQRHLPQCNFIFRFFLSISWNGVGLKRLMSKGQTTAINLSVILLIDHCCSISLIGHCSSSSITIFLCFFDPKACKIH